MNIRMRVPVRTRILMRYQTLVRNLTEISLVLTTDTEIVEVTTGQAYKSLKSQLHIPVKQVGESTLYTLRWWLSLTNETTELKLLS